MAGFFSTLMVNQDLYNSWAETLDWLFDDNRFPKEKGWEGPEVTKFTNRVKRLPGLKKENYIYEKSDLVTFPESHTFHVPVIMMISGSGQGRGIVTHIRNGIAHGRTRFFRENGELYLEIEDFGKKSSGGGRQTAYLYIPISYITQMHEIYSELEKARSNDRSKIKASHGKKRKKKKIG